MKLLKKAAMFGLDARIALAIFGALSVISGAALYSAIKEAKTTKTLVFLEEYSKATIQYYLDTGQILPNQSNSNSFMEGNLFNNYEGVNNWNGPYFGNGSNSNYSLSSSFISNLLGTSYSYTNGISTYKHKSTNWDSTTEEDFGEACNSDDCSMYLAIIGGGPTAEDKQTSNKTINELALSLDKKVDNGDGSRKGKIRYRITSDSSANSHIIYYKNMDFK
jgi:type II secretory pathway pseudopilin PulG